MGQVFTWEDVSKGQIPKLESFHRVAGAIRERFAREPSIVTALLFGSVVRGDFNIRSDIDCVVIYDWQREMGAMEVMHQVDAGGLIKGSLADLSPTIPAAQEIESYISRKMYSLQESFAQTASFSDERMASFLKKAFEAPMHVARKMLIYEENLRGDSKKMVKDAYCETMPAVLAGQFNRLLSADEYYSYELGLQLRKPDRSLYHIAIAGLLLELPQILEFLRANIIRLDEARR